MVERFAGIVKWSGTQDPKWDQWFPLSTKQVLSFPICEQCGVAVDCLVIDPRLSDEMIEKELEFLRERILYFTDHGRHWMPGTGQLAPGQGLP